MAKEKFSKHLVQDREERYITIATKVGFGTVQYSINRTSSDGREIIMELTTTGVVLVRALDKTIITMYCATISIAKGYFGIEKLPRDLLCAILSNQKRGYCGIQSTVF